MKIRYVIPFPFEDEGIAARAAQLPQAGRADDVEYDVVCAARTTRGIESPLEWALLDIYIAQAALDAEEQGCDAVVMDTVSDSGMAILRSRLNIPVIGPGIVQQHVAALLGRRFSILTMVPAWTPLYEKTLRDYGTARWCASIRSIDVEPDQLRLLAGKEDVVFERLVAQGRAAIEEDGADVLLMGSTTMHAAVDHLRSVLPVPVINPGPLAVRFAELAVRLGLSHSRRAFPEPEVNQDATYDAILGAAPGSASVA